MRVVTAFFPKRGKFIIQCFQAINTETIIIIFTNEDNSFIIQQDSMTLAVHNIAWFTFKAAATRGTVFFFMLSLFFHEEI